jgi:hypothetical protein
MKVDLLQIVHTQTITQKKNSVYISKYIPAKRCSTDSTVAQYLGKYERVTYLSLEGSQEVRTSPL